MTSDGAAGPDAADERRPDPAALDGSWTLVAGRGPDGAVPLLPGHPITLEVEGDRWAGTSGCNRYTASVAHDGDRVAFPRAVATTLMACADEVMAAELAFLVVLPTVERVEVGSEELVLRGPDVELRFVPTAVAPASAPLVGTDWAIVAIQAADADDTTFDAGPQRVTGHRGAVVGAPALRLDDDGRVRGTTGCNRVIGSYGLDGLTLTFGPLATTRMACDEAAARQEAVLLEVLSGATMDVGLAGAELRLTGAGGAIVCRVSR